MSGINPGPISEAKARTNVCLCTERNVSLEGSCAGFGDCLVLFAGAAADAEAADDFAVLLEGDAACEDHHLAAVGGVDAEELVAGLGVFAECLGFDVEGARGPGLLDGDVDGAEPGVGHALECEQVAAFVDYGDVHGLADFFGLGGGCRDDAASVCELQHKCSPGAGISSVI